MSLHSSVAAIAHVGRRLGELRDEVVFVGGAVVPLLLPPTVAPEVRPTEDVDCVVAVASYAEHTVLRKRLRHLGFAECTDVGAPICRWVVEETLVDVMPTDESVFGFNNRWYRHVLEDWTDVEVASDVTVRVIGPATFLATKFEAFADRGHHDYYSKDMEDIIMVLAHRTDIVELVSASTPAVHHYVRNQCQSLLTVRPLQDAIAGCFRPDDLSQASAADVHARMKRIAES